MDTSGMVDALNATIPHRARQENPMTASDKSRLIRMAADLPKGDKKRRAILAGLSKIASSKQATRHLKARSRTYYFTVSFDHDDWREVDRLLGKHGLDDDGGTMDHGNTEVEISQDDRGTDRGIEMTVEVSNWEYDEDAERSAGNIQQSFVRKGYAATRVFYR